MRLKLDLQLAYTDDNVPEYNEFTHWTKIALNQDKDMDATLCIRIVDEAESAQLNETYRKKQGPTNVLTFSYENAPGLQSGTHGDIIICAPVIEKEAKQQNKQLKSHWAHMVIHGVMHLRGYTHDTEKTATIMENIETEIMHSLGFENPYD